MEYPDLFLSFQHLTENMLVIKFRQRLDSNYGPLVLAATALLTEPEPLPQRLFALDYSVDFFLVDLSIPKRSSLMWSCDLNEFNRSLETNQSVCSAQNAKVKLIHIMGCGCDSVGRPVASDSIGLRFESSHRQIFILNISCQLYWKYENKEKEAMNSPFFRITYSRHLYLGSSSCSSTQFILQILHLSLISLNTPLKPLWIS